MISRSNAVNGQAYIICPHLQKEGMCLWSALSDILGLIVGEGVSLKGKGTLGRQNKQIAYPAWYTPNISIFIWSSAFKYIKYTDKISFSLKI